MAKDAEGDPIDLNSRTRVDVYGVLHLQKTGLKAGDILTVTATSAYTNPSGKTVGYTAEKEITIS